MESNNYSYDYNQLRNDIAPRTKCYLLLCQNIECTNNNAKPTTLWSRDNLFSWMVNLQCCICKIKWSVCIECSNMKTQLHSKKQITQHRFGYHKHSLKRKIIDNTVASNAIKTTKRQSYNEKSQCETEMHCEPENTATTIKLHNSPSDCSLVGNIL